MFSPFKILRAFLMSRPSVLSSTADSGYTALTWRGS